LASAEKLQVSPIPGLPRTAPVPTPAANRAIFSAPAPAAGKPSVGKVELNDGRFGVFVVTKVTPGDASQVPAEQQGMLREQLSQIDGGSAARAYVDAMRKRFKVTIEESQL
ncbi:peptidylprolyl isomerase, partial [Xanthomonas sp. Kuri4-1]